MDGGGQPTTRPLAILHMDDDHTLREITGLLLEHKGHHVVSCRDVDETVAAYREHLARGERFDLVILDLSIPGGKGGSEGMRELLAIDPEAKIVACSGAGPSASGDLERGFIGFIQKPFTAKGLDALAELLPG